MTIQTTLDCFFARRGSNRDATNDSNVNLVHRGAGVIPTESRSVVPEPGNNDEHQTEDQSPQLSHSQADVLQQDLTIDYESQPCYEADAFTPGTSQNKRKYDGREIPDSCESNDNVSGEADVGDLLEYEPVPRKQRRRYVILDSDDEAEEGALQSRQDPNADQTGALLQEMDNLQDEEEPAPVPQSRRNRRRYVIVDSNDEEEIIPPVVAGPSEERTEQMDADTADDCESASEYEIDSEMESDDDDDDDDQVLDEDIDDLSDTDDGVGEDHADDEVGEDEVIPGPDDLEVDLEDVDIGETGASHFITAAYAKSAVFEGMLRDVLEQLVQWTMIHNIRNLGRSDRPMSLGYWNILGRTSVDLLLSLYLPAIPIEVQRLFEQEEWSLNDLLDLPLAAEDTRQGVYVDFATGNIEHKKDIGCDTYVGSAKELRRRIGQHMKIARCSVNDLKPQNRRSFHYRQICRLGVRTNFRKLAAFDRPIAMGYLLLLEGVFMVLFGTYNYPHYYTDWSNKATYDLVAELRPSYLPPIPWKGMNAAWPLYQGFAHVGGRSPSPCANPECDAMTYPLGLVPEGEPRTRRKCADQGNPLGAYICGGCVKYLGYHNHLPNREACLLHKARRAARREAGKDAACHSCGRYETQFPPRYGYVKRLGKMAWLPKKHRLHDLVPGKLFCRACWKFMDRNGRTRSPDEVNSMIANWTLGFVRELGGEIRCENCRAPDGERPNQNCEKAKKILCRTCIAYFRETGEYRDEKLIRANELKRQQDQERREGKTIVCYNCKVPEGTLDDEPYSINRDIPAALCKLCDQYFRKEGRHRDVKLAHVNVLKLKFDKARADGEDIRCENCEDLEEADARRRFIINSKAGVILCPICDNFYRENGKHRDPKQARFTRKVNEIKAARKNGRILSCHRCQKVEGPSERHFRLNRELKILLCGACAARMNRENKKAKKAKTRE